MSSPPIRINQFGGLSPSVDERNLSPDGAQVARNLDMRFGDFRPSKGLGTSVATVPADTRSIFRTPSGVWLSSSTDTDYVNAQINDAATERVYLTGRSAFPEAWENGTYRRLGVPRPATAPLVSAQTQDEFDQTDADAAQKAAADATVADLLAADAQVWLGAAIAATGAPPTVDPLYDKVQLHMQFNTAPGGNFVDSSPQQRVLTNSGAVALTTNTSGPLGTGGGAGYGTFSGGHVLVPYIDRKSFESDPTWTVDATIRPTENLEWVVLFARNGGLREITFQRAGQPDVVGNYRTLTSSDFGGAFTAIIRCKRPDNSLFCAAGASAHVSVQNTGSRMEVYIDGVLCGTYADPQHLEIHNVGRSSFTGTQAFQGQIDELRVTFAARNTGTFTKPTGEYGRLAQAPGLFLAHADASATSLPTSDAGDAAYIVPMTLVGGQFQITNAADQYLSDPSLRGVQITYSGSPYWAVPLANWRASGLSLAQATAQTVLANVTNPASPPAKLLTAPQAAALAPFVFALYDPSGANVLPLVTALNSAQAALRAQLAATPGNAALTATRVAEVATASKALEDYFAGMDAELRKVLAANASLIFGAITSLVVSRLLETRGYIVTYITDWGEESQPSLPSELLTIDQNDAVQITVPAPPAGRNIVGYRVYRSSTTNNGAAFQLVDAKDASNAVLLEGAFDYLTFANRVYLDTAKQEELQEECPSLIWAEPPENLQGLVGMPNGIMLGFFGKTLCACVGYRPHAWPVEFQQTLEYDIVGIGVFGQTAVVLTEGHPYYVSGADAASLSAQKIEIPQACIAKRTIAEVEGGVIYASPDGLCLASPSGVDVLTKGAFSKDDWQTLVNASAFGGYSDGSYYLFTDDA